MLKIYWWLITAGPCKSKLLIPIIKTPHDSKPISLTHLICYICSHCEGRSTSLPHCLGGSRRATLPGYLGLSLNVTLLIRSPYFIFFIAQSVDNIFLFSTAYPYLVIANMYCVPDIILRALHILATFQSSTF